MRMREGRLVAAVNYVANKQLLRLKHLQPPQTLERFSA